MRDGGAGAVRAVEGPVDPRRSPLCRRRLEGALVTGAGRSWRALEVVGETGSTNADLVARARAGEPEGLVLVADHQSAGRGRLTRSWSAPAGASLAVSVLLRPGVDQRYWSWLPLLAGLSVVDALRGECGLGAVVKWPNDVLVPGPAPAGGAADPGKLLKVCGILAEVVPGVGGAGGVEAGWSGTAVVVGAGLNVSQGPGELPVPTAGSLVMAGAEVVDRDAVLIACLRALAARYAAWQEGGGDPRAGLSADFVRSCVTLGRRVAVRLPGRDRLLGTADGIDDEGRLLVTNDSGRRHVLAAGDVVHVRGTGASGPVPGLV
ncbi:MAG: BirA family transcriptional regulator [Actinomycetota bacterium]|nr:BirA family transcriptional regulator [Actinomycetota bacterium]